MKRGKKKQSNKKHVQSKVTAPQTEAKQNETVLEPILNCEPTEHKQLQYECSLEDKNLYDRLLELATNIEKGYQLNDLISVEEQLTLRQQLKRALLTHIHHIKMTLENQGNIDEGIHSINRLISVLDIFIGNLLIAKQSDEALPFANLIRKRYLDLKEIIDHVIPEIHIKDLNLKSALYQRLIDSNCMLVMAYKELGRTQESLNYIDETLDLLDSLNLHPLTSLSFLYEVTALQFWTLGDIANTNKWLLKTLNVYVKWYQDEEFRDCLFSCINELLKKDFANATVLIDEVFNKTNNGILKDPNWYKNEEMINCVGKCIRALMQTKQSSDVVRIKGLCNALIKKGKQVKFAKDCIGILETRAIKSATLRSKEQDRITKNCVTVATDICPPKNEQVAEVEPVEDKQNQPKEKPKTRGIARPSENNSEIAAEEPVSDAIKYGFSEVYANETIHPLRSDLIPEGTYYALYPQANLTAYPDIKQTHAKIQAILKEGKIGASGNRVRYTNKKDKFKVGNKHSNDRFFSRIAEEVVVNDKRRVLLIFSEKHNHNTQQREYEIKSPTVRRTK